MKMKKNCYLINENKCSKCRLLKTNCYCSILQQIETKIKLNVIMHVRELTLSSSTVNLLKNVVPDTKIHLRGHVDYIINENDVIKENCNNIFLYPDENSKILTQENIKVLSTKPINLIIPDGSWRQAKKMKRRYDWLDKIQSYRLPENLITNFKLRSSNSKNKLSTYESIIYAIYLLDNKPQPFLNMSMNNTFIGT
jgi:DTW domain-containing protein YfiP